MTADESVAAELAERFAAVRARIDAAARAAGRDGAGVRLVAVSKTKPAEFVRAAYALGQRDFGENYVQELIAKREALGDLPGLVWHAIGHVQTNKARELVRAGGAVVHTVDSPRLAVELGRRAEATAVRVDVMVQVNVGGEAQKSGCNPVELAAVLDAVRGQSALTVRGLMTIPPHTDDPAGARPYFESLSALRDAHGGASVLPDLSMGMTHDLEVAVACGATIVRVGTAIFGARGAAL